MKLFFVQSKLHESLITLEQTIIFELIKHVQDIKH